MIKGSIQEEDITVVNIYAPNIEAPQYIRQGKDLQKINPKQLRKLKAGYLRR